MKTHFTLVNQIKRSQAFVKIQENEDLLSNWQEIHKRKWKRKFLIYLKLLKNHKKAFFKGHTLISYHLLLEDKIDKSQEKSIYEKAHNNLFLNNKLSSYLNTKAVSTNFSDAEIIKTWKSFRIGGYNFYCEMIILPHHLTKTEALEDKRKV